MIRMMIVLTAKSPADADTVRDLLAQHGKLSAAEPGCARFEVYQSSTSPETFLISEWWETQEALDVHRTAEGYTTIYQPQVLPLVERTAHRCELVG